MALTDVDILGVRVQPVTYADTLRIVARWIADGGPHQLVTANPEFVMAAQHNEAFRSVLDTADLCVPDGVGLLWAARILGQVLPERVTGSDLVPLLASVAARQDWRIFLLGAAPRVAQRTASLLVENNPGLNIVGAYSGSPAPEESAAIVAWVRMVRPDILFVAFGAPRQDLWIHRYRDQLSVPVMMGVGGAFDHIAGVQRRAPAWIQRIHLEWLFRLFTQPWRWRRQLALPRFVLAVLWRRLGPVIWSQAVRAR